MNNNFEYLDIILLAMIAGFIILRLRGILGRKSGHEDKNYRNPYSKNVVKESSKEKIVSLNSSKLDEAAKKQFITGAEVAYETIITSFAKGDKKTLKPLLNKEIYQNFSDEIDKRKKENFIPHITVGRISQFYWKIDVLPFLKYVYSPIQLDINSVALYESQPLPKGTEYKILTEFPLN